MGVRSEDVLFSLFFLTFVHELALHISAIFIAVSRCAGCLKSIQPGEQYLTAEGRRFHDECLVCNLCEDPLQDNPFVIDSNRYKL